MLRRQACSERSGGFLSGSRAKMVTDLCAGFLLLGPSMKCHASNVRELEI